MSDRYRDPAWEHRAPATRRIPRAWMSVGSVLAAITLLVACGDADRCRDAGGRWNADSTACEFVPGPIDTPALAIDAGRRALEFAYGPEVLTQDPFVAELAEDVWHVYGTHPRGSFGSSAHAWIAMADGRVERIEAGESR